MKFVPTGGNLIFLGTSGVGSNFGQIAPQVRVFDVYYTVPPVVGFHVVGTFTPAQVATFCGEEG